MPLSQLRQQQHVHHLWEEKIGPYTFLLTLTSSLFFFTLCFYNFFFPFWKTKYADYTVFQKSIQLLPITKRNSLFTIKVLGIFPWQVQNNERVTASQLKRLFFALQLCKILIGITVGTNSVSQVLFSCWQAVSSQDISCERSKVWKNKQSSNFRRWRGDKDLSRHFSTMENHPAFSIAHARSLQSLLACYFLRGGERKSHLF